MSRRRRTGWGALAIVLAIAGCGATTKSRIAFHDEYPRDAADAIIYVYRTKSMVGAAVPWNVRLDGQIVGVLRQNAYMPLHVLAGEHSLMIGDTTTIAPSPGTGVSITSSDRFAVAPGGVYYCRSKGFDVSFLTREQAMPELSRMRLDTGIK